MCMFRSRPLEPGTQRLTPKMRGLLGEAACFEKVVHVENLDKMARFTKPLENLPH